MHIIKLDATDSTNLYLKNLMLSSLLEDLTVVVAKAQTRGRGQMGTKWDTKPGKNLTFSILKKIDDFSITDQFQLNIVVSLAIFDTLKALKVPHLKIKWPNDILSGTYKLGGILIENMLKGNQIRSSIIGIGLNVNQTDFHHHFNATSLKLLLGRAFNIDVVLHLLLKNLIDYLQLLESGEISGLTNDYVEALFGMGEATTFQRPDGELFIGTIKGVSENGKLQVLLEGKQLKEYGLKEIKLIH
jgi:BirA family biotin operon repressor/biotin-[acetyl-CoA-carboxylase] ligase